MNVKMLSSPRHCVSLLLAVFVSGCYGYSIRYDGYKVLRVDASNERHLRLMNQLQHDREIAQWVKDIAATYPSLATEVQVGLSYEGRELRALKVGSEQSESKEAIWFHGTLHSREWISPATVMFMTNQLLVDYSHDPDVQKYLDTYDFYILPVMNPDGYEYTWTDNRLWRKTRSPNEGSPCYGTDGNRNFEFMWGEPGASDDPCDNNYRGPFAHSEIEVKSVTDFILDTSEKQTFSLFIDFHCYGQMWITPWAYSIEEPLHYSEQHTCAGRAASAIESVHGTPYIYGNIISNADPASGLTLDWGYGTANIKHSYLVELRDRGEYGFLLPEDQIIPSGEETYAGLKAMLDCILEGQVV
ncbi:carboxypeptidase B-like isoform X2 [Ptychodera flava]|uniref:carboxypeptidase B-like isoform X2 n=1 Tax=Ptychodera flava TaxID=63121 RepID=UPI00396A2EB6